MYADPREDARALVAALDPTASYRIKENTSACCLPGYFGVTAVFSVYMRKAGASRGRYVADLIYRTI